MAHVDRYHYSECGLDNIYLYNGFEFVETPRGRAVNIRDIEGLHRAIGLILVRDKKNQYLMLDSTIVRAHQQAATGRKKGAPTRLWGVPEEV